MLAVNFQEPLMTSIEALVVMMIYFSLAAD